MMPSLRRFIARLRRRILRWIQQKVLLPLLADLRVPSLHVEQLRVGANSIQMSPAGAGDVIRWSAAQAAAQALDLGMSADGHPVVYVGGAAANLATATECPSIIAFGVGDLDNSTETLYLLPWNGPAHTAIPSPQSLFVPRAGTISKLYAQHKGNAGSSEVETYTVMKNGVATALEVVINGNSSAVVADTTHSLTVAAGDYISLRIVRSVATSTHPTLILASMSFGP